MLKNNNEIKGTDVTVNSPLANPSGLLNKFKYYSLCILGSNTL